MRIAYLYDAVYPFTKGGGERRIYEVARRLSDRGHEIFILGMKCWDGPASLRKNGLCYRAISPPINFYSRRGRRAIWQPLGFGAAACCMLTHPKYDIIDCGQFPFLHLFAGKAYSLVRRTPFIATWYEVLRQDWLRYYGTLGFAAVAAEKVLSRFPDKIVAISERTQARLLDLGVKRHRITLIPNGVDFRRIQSVAPGRIRTDLAYLGRLKNHKNVHCLIEVLAVIKRTRPGILAVVIGDGPELAALRALAVRLGVAENVIFTGALEDFEEVIAWLKASKIFFDPSTKECGSTITLFEANACGLPVMAVRCPNGMDALAVQEGANGYLVDLDPQQIARTVLELLDSPQRLAANAVACREFAAKYDWDLVASQHEQLYVSQLSAHGTFRPAMRYSR